MSDPAVIAAEIRTELRSILRRRDDLRKPLDRFGLVDSRSEGEPRYYVLFDDNPRLVVKGLRYGGCGVIRLADERIIDQFLDFAKSVWHFKDRLKLLLKAQGQSLDVEAAADPCQDLLLCSDLANWKKHGENRNRSALSPRVETVAFDTSHSGAVEIYLDGATKHQELLVANAVPISYTIELAGTWDKLEINLGSGIDLVERAFREWLTFVNASGVLSDDTRENEHLRQMLFPSSTTPAYASAPDCPEGMGTCVYKP